MWDEALKTYKQLETMGQLDEELRLKVSKVESIINDEQLDLSEIKDKKTSKSIKFNGSITYQDKKSSKSSKNSLRKIRNALEGIYSSEMNNISDAENPDRAEPGHHKVKDNPEKQKIKLSKSKFEQINVSTELISMMEEVKLNIADSTNSSSKKTETEHKEENVEIDGSNLKTAVKTNNFIDPVNTVDQIKDKNIDKWEKSLQILIIKSKFNDIGTFIY